MTDSVLIVQASSASRGKIDFYVSLQAGHLHLRQCLIVPCFMEPMPNKLGGTTRIVEGNRRKCPRTNKANTMKTNHTLTNKPSVDSKTETHTAKIHGKAK